MLRLCASLALSLVLFGGCAPRLVVSSMQPASVNVGAIETIKLADGQGRRSAREFLVQETAGQIRTMGYFAVRDVSDSGLQIELAGRTATIRGDEMVAGEGVLRLDVYEWTGELETRNETYKDRDGVERSRQVRVGTGRVILGATLVDADGRALLAEREYETTREVRTDDRDVAIEAAARVAVTQLLNDITPRLVRRRVRLDNSNKEIKPIVKTARGGNISQAAEELRRYLTTTPGDAAASYNLAVFLDAMGQYEEALAMYDQAIRSTANAPGYYSDARAQCARRMSDAEALMQ